MALGSVALVKRDFGGTRKRNTFTIQLTAGANYTTGGETITPAQVGFGHRIIQVIPEGLATTTSGTTSRAVSFIHQTDGSVKMQVQTTASAEAASNSDQSTFTVRADFIGH